MNTKINSTTSMLAANPANRDPLVILCGLLAFAYGGKPADLTAEFERDLDREIRAWRPLVRA